jgi:beta-glucanase (GH16 family)
MKACLFLFTLVLSAPASDWRLVWSDDFDRPGAPDPAKWTYEQGFERNQELQFYTNRSKNVRVENGHLVIEAHHEALPNPMHKAGDAHWKKARAVSDYTSASLTTRRLKSFHYGRIEVRAKLPSGKGVWPAIWLLGDNQGGVRWPACGEIDIMEFVSHLPGKAHCCVHSAKPGTTDHQMQGHFVKSDTLHSEFHVYGVDWNDKSLTFRFDGKPFKTIELDHAGQGPGNPFRQPDSFYLILNLAIGGLWGKEADPAVYPQRLEIDWVRAWEK